MSPPPNYADSESTNAQGIGPGHRLDEAIKQITIAREKTDGDVDQELQEAVELLQSLRTKLADDE